MFQLQDGDVVPRASGFPELDTTDDVTVLCGGSVAREEAGAAFGVAGSGPRHAAALDDEASTCAELARVLWASSSALRFFAIWD